MPDWDSLKAELKPVVDEYIDQHPELAGAYQASGASLFADAQPASDKTAGQEPAGEAASIEEEAAEILAQFRAELEAEAPEIMVKVSEEIAEEEPDLGLTDLFGEITDEDFEQVEVEVKDKLDRALGGEFELLGELEDVKVEYEPLTPEEVEG
jgi:hypothetical protein